MVWLPVVQRFLLVLVFMGLSAWNLATWSPEPNGFWLRYGLLVLGLPLALYWFDRQRFRDVPIRRETDRWSAFWLRLWLYFVALALMQSEASLGFGWRTGGWKLELSLFLGYLVILAAEIVGLEMWAGKQRHNEDTSHA